MPRVRKGLWPGTIFVLLVFLVVPGRAPAEEAGRHFYFGQIHSHTSYSDGVLTPEDAYTYARDVADLDFLGITEHGYYMFENPHHWEALVETARRFCEPGRFVAFRGTEWTHGAGHISVIEAPEPCSRDEQISFDDLVAWMEGKNGIASFNHPGRNEQGNWDDFEYSLGGNRTIRLLEVGSGPYPRNTFYEASYIRALDRGWRVGAINSQDNHRADWGTAADTRTGVVARALTREDLLEALRAMCTYCTEDKNVRARFTGNGRWMGEVLPPGEVEFEIDISDPDPGDVVEKVEVRSNRGAAVMTFQGDGVAGGPGESFHTAFAVVPSQGYNWYYVRAEQKDGDIIVTSPIWVKSPSDLMIVDLRFDAPFLKKGALGHLRGEVVNLGESAVHGAIIEFSATARAGRTPIGAVRADAGPGETAPFSIEWACPVSGDVTVSATVVDPSMPTYTANVYSIPLKVLPETLPKVMLDEGHNNRASGFGGKFLESLAREGCEGALNRGRITREVLKDVSLLVVASPEPGISLTPTAFDDEELAAVREFIERGGALLLAGSSDASDPSRSPGELNAILAAIGSSMRFSDDEVQQKTDSAASATITCNLTPAGTQALGAPSLSLRMTQACSIADDGFGDLGLCRGVLVLAVGSEGTRSVDTNGGGAYHPYASGPVVCAAEDVGKGRVVAMGAPMYSVYDLRPGLGNEEFMARLVAWLLSR